MRFVGIDPGFSGAICLLTKDGKDIETIWSIPILEYVSPLERKKKKPKVQKQIDHSELQSIFFRLPKADIIVCLEHVWARGNDSAIVAWQLGGSYFALKQEIEHHMNIDLLLPEISNPFKWKKHYGFDSAGKGLTGSEKKKVIDQYAIDLVKDVFPNSWEKICPIGKRGKPLKPNPNWADAALLAGYARDTYYKQVEVA